VPEDLSKNPVKMSSEVMGLDSGGDDGLDLEEKEAERKMLNRRET